MFCLTEFSPIHKKFQSLLWEDVRIISGLASILPVAGRVNIQTRSTLITDLYKNSNISQEQQNVAPIILQ